MAAPSQTVQAKAAEYLLTGRVRVDYASTCSFAALVTGRDPEPYIVAYRQVDQQMRWTCSCPASRVCAHILACQAIWQPTAAEQVA